VDKARLEAGPRAGQDVRGERLGGMCEREGGGQEIEGGGQGIGRGGWRFYSLIYYAMGLFYFIFLF